MSLLRAAARTMLASYFVVNGLKAFRHPEPLTPAAEPLAQKLLPLAGKVVPHPLLAYLPEDARGLVRCTGITQVIGGVCLATGICRRLGAGLLAASMVPQLLAADPRKAPNEARADAEATLLASVALTGATVLASLDTQGSPDLAWRARAQKDAAARGTDRLKGQAGKDAARSIRRAKRAVRTAGRTIESARS